VGWALVRPQRARRPSRGFNPPIAVLAHSGGDRDCVAQLGYRLPRFMVPTSVPENARGQAALRLNTVKIQKALREAVREPQPATCLTGPSATCVRPPVPPSHSFQMVINWSTASDSLILRRRPWPKSPKWTFRYACAAHQACLSKDVKTHCCRRARPCHRHCAMRHTSCSTQS
jgi:hypothetical protein